MLEVRLLGQFDICLNGTQVIIPSRVDQSLLAYLTLNAGSSFRREYLAGLFWPDSDEVNAKGYLRQALWRLRKALSNGQETASEYLLADKIGIAFNTRLSYWLDAAVLEDEQAGGIEGLLGSTRVYTGELLPGFYDDWLLVERERLRGLFDRKMQRLLEGLQAERRWEDLLQQAERWIALGDSPEPAYRAMILVHAAQGDIPRALAAYQRCVQILERELAVSPSPETTYLAEQVRAGKPISEILLPKSRESQDLHQPVLDQGQLSKTIFPHKKGPSEPFNNLPVQVTPFVGRESELSEIAAVLTNPDCRLLTLVGPGGIGKTRLALKVGEQLQQTFPQGVCFVPLAGIESIDLFPSSLLGALAINLLGESDPKQLLFNYLRKREMLLIFDNFEHLVDSTELLTSLIQQAPGVKLLVISRKRLNLQQEWVFRLEGLPYPLGDAGENIEKYASITLFVQAAQRVQSNFALDESNDSSVAGICRLVEGMPLAIELAAAWMPVMDSGEIEREVEHSLDILEMDMQDLPKRQRSMRAVFNTSWDMLYEEEQISMGELSVFRGGFTREAAEKVFGISRKMILALINKCWVRPGAGGRFHIHELIRQYVSEHLLLDRNLWERAREAHSAYFCGFLKDREIEWYSSRTMQIISDIKGEIQNIELAWKWALENANLDLIGQAMECLNTFYYRLGRWREGEAGSRNAAECLGKIIISKSMDAVEARFLRIRALTWQGVFSSEIQSSVRLFRDAKTIIELLECAGHDIRKERANILTAEGDSIQFYDPQKSWELFSQSVKLYEELGDETGQGKALYELALSAWLLGKLDDAMRLLQQSISIKTKCGEYLEISGCNDLMAKILREKGRFEEAKQYHLENLAVARKLGNLKGEAIAFINLANTLISDGQFGEARSIAEESLSFLRTISERDLPYFSSTLARALMHLGEYDSAAEWLTRSEEDAQKTDYAFVGISKNNTGEISLARKQLAEALDQLQESLAIAETNKQYLLTGYPLADLAFTAHALHQPDQAYQYLRQCLEESVRVGSFRQAVHAIPAIALLEADQGNIERAVELYGLACNYPYVANSKWFEDIAGRQIAALAASLPPETAAAAQGRGRSLDIWETIEQWLDQSYPYAK